MECVELAKKIRAFELAVLKEYKKGNIKGTVHCCIGQEYDTVQLIQQLKPGDIITSTHRGHGHFLAFTKNFTGLWDELHGLPTGINQGKALSQHLHAKNFYTTGIQGGMLPIACGMALAQKLKKTGNVVMSFLGDGTLGEGILYESLNIASLWKLPLIFILENNHYEMSTPTHNHTAGSIKQRFEAFGIYQALKNIRKLTPAYKIIDTYRHCGHSGRDDRCYRTKEEEYHWRQKDKLGGYLLDELLSP